MMKITTEKAPEMLVIVVEGRLDALTAGEFEKEVTPLVQPSGQNVLLDFEKLDYISSAGLRSVLILIKEMKTRGNLLGLCCLNETIREVFCISGFDSIIAVYATKEEGLSALNAK